jgi:hypothetical protein
MWDCADIRDRSRGCDCRVKKCEFLGHHQTQTRGGFRHPKPRAPDTIFESATIGCETPAPEQLQNPGSCDKNSFKRSCPRLSYGKPRETETEPDSGTGRRSTESRRALGMQSNRARITCTFKAVSLETTSAQLVSPQNSQSLCSLCPLWFNPGNNLKNIS